MVVKAFHLGADGYLPKKNLDTNLLVYGICLALERKMQVLKQNEAKQEQNRQREIEWLEQLANSVKTGVTARMFGSEPLRDSVPDVFEELVGNYGDLMDLALEQETYKIDFLQKSIFVTRHQGFQAKFWTYARGLLSSNK